jgi:hypothetical protein
MAVGYEYLDSPFPLIGLILSGWWVIEEWTIGKIC